MTVFKHNQVNGLSQVIDHTFMMKSLSPEHFRKLQELNQQEDIEKKSKSYSHLGRKIIMCCPSKILIPILTGKMFIVYTPPKLYALMYPHI